MRKIKALVLTSKANFELKTIDSENLKSDYATVNPSYVGVCGSDLPRYFSGAVHSFPQVLGHEFSGIISDIDETHDFKIGDRVVVAPLIPCRECTECRKGNPAMCLDYDFIGSRSQGAMAESVSVPIRNLVRIPDSLPLREAALVEPLTVAIHGVDRADFNLGEKVLILGAGTIGLLTLIAVLKKGVNDVVVVDIDDNKLSIARQLGCIITINPLNEDLETYFSENSLPSIVFETAGSSITQVQAVDLCEKKGQVVFIGTSTKPVIFEPHQFEKILRGELRLTGSWMSYSELFPGYEWSAAVSMINNNLDMFSMLITSIHRLEDLSLPFETMADSRNSAVKVLYEIGGN